MRNSKLLNSGQNNNGQRKHRAQETSKPQIYSWPTVPRQRPLRPEAPAPQNATAYKPAMIVWGQADSETQSRIFRDQLLSAKCPKALMDQMTMFWSKKHGQCDGFERSSAQDVTVYIDNGFDTLVNHEAIPTRHQESSHKCNMDRSGANVQDMNTKSTRQLSATSPVDWSSAQAGANLRRDVKTVQQIPACSQRHIITEKAFDKDDRYTRASQTTGTLPPQENIVMTLDKGVEADTVTSARTIRPLPNMKAMLEERLRDAQLKRTLKAEQNKANQTHKRVKLDSLSS